MGGGARSGLRREGAGEVHVLRQGEGQNRSASRQAGRHTRRRRRRQIAGHLQKGGASRKGELVGTKWNTKVSSDYINVPVLIEYKLLGGNLALMAGPQLGYCLGKTVKNVTGDTTTSTKADKDNYNAFDAGVTIGATYMVIPNVGIDLRYNLGLTNTGTDSDNVMNNRVLSIGACYMF